MAGSPSTFPPTCGGPATTSSGCPNPPCRSSSGPPSRTLLPFDGAATESRVLALEAAERSDGLIVDVSDAATTIVEVRFERYRPEGAAEGILGGVKRVVWTGLADDAGRFGDIPALQGPRRNTTRASRPDRSSGPGGSDGTLTVDRMPLLRNAAVVLAAAAAIGTWQAPRLYSWAYLFAGDRYGVHLVAYPPGYMGAGGTLRVTVGIDPASPHAREMVPSVRNIVATFNALRPTTGNLALGADNDVAGQPRRLRIGGAARSRPRSRSLSSERRQRVRPAGRAAGLHEGHGGPERPFRPRPRPGPRHRIA